MQYLRVKPDTSCDTEGPSSQRVIDPPGSELGTEAPPRPPVQDAQRAPEHPPQMSEMRHALLPAGHAVEQLGQGIHRYEQPRRYRDGYRYDEQALPGEIPREGEQHAEHA